MTDNERAFREAFDAHAPEPALVDAADWLPACVHRLHRPHVAGLVWRETCPACNGDGCRECDQTGMVDMVLSPAEARKRLEGER